MKFSSVTWWDAERGTMAHAHHDPTSGQTVYWHENPPSLFARARRFLRGLVR